MPTRNSIVLDSFALIGYLEDEAFAASMAIIQNSSLLTGDPEFKKLEKEEDISIEWLI